MKKRNYERPAMKVVELQHRSSLLVGSTYETTGNGKTSITSMGTEEDL